jgi:hypothetical protein
MQHKVHGDEVPGSGEMLRGVKQMISHEFVAVEGQIVLEEDPCDTIQRRRMHKPQDHPAYCF